MGIYLDQYTNNTLGALDAAVASVVSEAMLSGDLDMLPNIVIREGTFYATPDNKTVKIPAWVQIVTEGDVSFVTKYDEPVLHITSEDAVLGDGFVGTYLHASKPFYTIDGSLTIHRKEGAQSTGVGVLIGNTTPISGIQNHVRAFNARGLVVAGFEHNFKLAANDVYMCNIRDGTSSRCVNHVYAPEHPMGNSGERCVSFHNYNFVEHPYIDSDQTKGRGKLLNLQTGYLDFAFYNCSVDYIGGDMLEFGDNSSRSRVSFFGCHFEACNDTGWINSTATSPYAPEVGFVECTLAPLNSYEVGDLTNVVAGNSCPRAELVSGNVIVKGDLSVYGYNLAASGTSDGLFMCGPSVDSNRLFVNWKGYRQLLSSANLVAPTDLDSWADGGSVSITYSSGAQYSCSADSGERWNVRYHEFPVSFGQRLISNVTMNASGTTSVVNTSVTYKFYDGFDNLLSTHTTGDYFGALYDNESDPTYQSGRNYTAKGLSLNEQYVPAKAAKCRVELTISLMTSGESITEVTPYVEVQKA